MTSDASYQGLWLLYVGGDFKLWYRNDNSGDLTKSSEKYWGSSHGIRGEPNTLMIWDNGIQVYHVDAQNGHLMAKATKTDSPANASDGWYDLGGVLAGSPVSCYYDVDNKMIDVFAVGMDGQVWSCYYNTKWTWYKLWTDLNPVAFEPERIFCSSNGKRRIDVVAASVTNDLYHRYWNGSAWSGWTSVGKTVVGSRPICWTPNADRVDIVCKNAQDQKLYHTANDHGVWLGWQKVSDNTVVFDPSGCYCPNSKNRYHLAAIDITGAMIYTALTFKDGERGSWENTQNISGVHTASPKITHRENGIVEVFGRGTNSDMWNKTLSGSWSGWKNLKCTSQSKPC